MDKKYYAHSLEEEPPERWQPLAEHLNNVAKRASAFAKDFDAADWAFLAGLWHDLGKYSLEFQNMLMKSHDPDAHIETRTGKVDHSSAGAQHAFRLFNDVGKLLAYIISGHHAGLPDGKSNDSACLASRLNKKIPDYSGFSSCLSQQPKPATFPFCPDQKRLGFQLSFFTRMIYSCLVDADFLDTEAFMDKRREKNRRGYPELADLSSKLESAVENILLNARQSTINDHRRSILQHCIDASQKPQGIFSLTVPTGGGKTLSSMAFAMNHALKHNLKRIICIIPYTSIIEQNAAVFRRIFGDLAVLEHHSNFEPPEEDHRSRLASENWDAPVIVTTNVQFFESLFGARSSRCRRLHNIARSVVILDEAQMLPVPFLKPCLEALRELAESYRTTVVLCTATQPALSTTEKFEDGLDSVYEIIPEPQKIYVAFRRITTEQLPVITDEELSGRILSFKQTLCIVNTRKHARRIYELIKDREGCFHLSALMCPQHRSEVLQRIREALLKKSVCRVVSTQLVEAGVDIDFPVVFRSSAGIDSLAQAAGRCNREGLIDEGGRFYVFQPEQGLPPGYFRRTAETAEIVMRHHDDPLSISAVEEYFETLYWRHGEALDEEHILDLLREGASRGDFPFRTIAEVFKIIKDTMQPIIIPWGREADRIIQGLRFAEKCGGLLRKAQRYTAQVFPKVLSALVAAGSVELVHGKYAVLINKDLYREDLGLCPEDPTFHKIENLIL